MAPTRRGFLQALAVSSSSLMLPRTLFAAATDLHVATNVYPWLTFYGRDKKDFNADLDASLAEVARSGVNGFEPIANRPEDLKKLEPLLKKHKLAMRSLYVNSKLHDKTDADESIKQVLAIAETARTIGCRIIVTNPTPIRWGGPENKNDEQLKVQAEKLDRLGSELRKRDVTLAYHNHDAEMRQSAREFHHMMCGTDPAHVSLCLDAHWIFRGSGDSQVALFDIVTLYAKRIVELHLRQSKNGVWTEVFGDGDIDYARLAKVLTEHKLRPHVVLEQAVEAKSAKSINVVEAHAKGRKYTDELFAKLA